ncbi:MAG: hypothetical protein WAT09_05300 [Paracoccaceae bacterium]
MAWGSPSRLDASAVIDLADCAGRLSPGQWSVALLRHAYPDAADEAVLALPVGARDRLVLDVRARLAAGPLRAEPVCDACGATYELTLDPAEFGLAGDAPWPDPGFCGVQVGGVVVNLRPVSLGDLLAVETVVSPQAAAEMLAVRVQEGAFDLPAEALEAALETLDPGADVWLQVACPDCDARQSVAFDAVHFVAHELRQMSKQVLQDVVDIARVFHWSEADILALPDHRRAFYVAEALG